MAATSSMTISGLIDITTGEEVDQVVTAEELTAWGFTPSVAIHPVLNPNEFFTAALEYLEELGYTNIGDACIEYINYED